MRGVYLDNAATSWPKPKAVLKGMARYFRHIGGSAGRSGHWRAVEAGRIVLAARQALAECLNLRDESHLVFTKNGSEALNLVLRGVLKPGDHAVTTTMEHNSVLRPLLALRKAGVTVSYVEGDRDGRVDPLAIAGAVSEKTRLVIATHGSNVTGTLNDIEHISRICREKGTLLLVDAAQTAGAVPLDLDSLQADFVAMAGHKGLLGPQGTGALYIREKEGLEPLMRGGTGSLSDSEEMPGFLPDRYESGTLNLIGLAGLEAGCRFLLRRGISRIRDHEKGLQELFLDQLRPYGRIRVYGPADAEEKTGVLSVNIEGRDCSSVGQQLDEEYGICTRIGMHCAPRAHRTIGTYPTGTVRFSWGPSTREKDILRAARALVRIAR